MDGNKLKSLNDLNKSIIRFRNIYSRWSSKQGIGYHELLIYYTVREYGYCSQKMICESYLLPKQTISNVFARLYESGIIEKADSRGREALFVLTERGKEKYRAFASKLDRAESSALNMLGQEKLDSLKNVLLEYDKALALAFESQNKDD